MSGDAIRESLAAQVVALQGEVAVLVEALCELADSYVDLHARLFPDMSVTKQKRYADARALLAKHAAPESRSDRLRHQ